MNFMATRMLYHFRMFTMLIYSSFVYSLYKIQVEVYYRQLSAQCWLPWLVMVTTF